MSIRKRSNMMNTSIIMIFQMKEAMIMEVIRVMETTAAIIKTIVQTYLRVARKGQQVAIF